MSLQSRKKSVKRRTSSIQKRVESETTKKSYDDPNIWKLERGADDVGQAVIRFLEPSDADIKYFVEQGMSEDEVPFYVKRHEHAFKGETGRWYFNNCPTSNVDWDCPVCNANREIIEAGGGWDALDDKGREKALVRSRNRSDALFANILVIQDKMNPENEGKIKVFKFSRMVFNMINAQLIPEFDDEEPCDVSNFWEGKNFNLKMTKKNKFFTYEKSSWSDVKPLGSDDEIEEVIKGLHTLHTYITPDNYKSTEDLAKDFAATQAQDDSPLDEDGAEVEVEESKPKRSTPAKRRSRTKVHTSDENPDEDVPNYDSDDSSSDDSDDEPDDDYFDKLLED